jgi:hypothetical protein
MSVLFGPPKGGATPKYGAYHSDPAPQKGQKTSGLYYLGKVAGNSAQIPLKNITDIRAYNDLSTKYEIPEFARIAKNLNHQDTTFHQNHTDDEKEQFATLVEKFFNLITGTFDPAILKNATQPEIQAILDGLPEALKGGKTGESLVTYMKRRKPSPAGKSTSPPASPKSKPAGATAPAEGLLGDADDVDAFFSPGLVNNTPTPKAGAAGGAGASKPPGSSPTPKPAATPAGGAGASKPPGSTPPASPKPKQAVPFNLTNTLATSNAIMNRLTEFKLNSTVFATDALDLFLKIDELCENISTYLISSGITAKSGSFSKEGKQAAFDLDTLVRAKQDLINLQLQIQPAALEKLRSSSFKTLFNGEGDINVSEMLSRFDELTQRYNRDRARFELTIKDLDVNLKEAQSKLASPKSLPKDEVEIKTLGQRVLSLTLNLGQKEVQIKELIASMNAKGGVDAQLGKAQADLAKTRSELSEAKAEIITLRGERVIADAKLAALTIEVSRLKAARPIGSSPYASPGAWPASFPSRGRAASAAAEESFAAAKAAVDLVDDLENIPDILKRLVSKGDYSTEAVKNAHVLAMADQEIKAAKAGGPDSVHKLNSTAHAFAIQAGYTVQGGKWAKRSGELLTQTDWEDIANSVKRTVGA